MTCFVSGPRSATLQQFDPFNPHFVPNPYAKREPSQPYLFAFLPQPFRLLAFPRSPNHQSDAWLGPVSTMGAAAHSRNLSFGAQISWPGPINVAGSRLGRRKPSWSQGYNLRGRLDHAARCRRDNDAALGREIENKKGIRFQDTKPAGTSGREKREPMPRRNEDNVHSFTFPRHSAPIAGCNDAIRSPLSRPEFRSDLPMLLLRLALDTLSALVHRHMHPAVSPKQRSKVPYL
ncbi:hypothetical protein BDP55DRAFT_324182 [Colletotrichum godetiae]|uniref:Uncharacterized protein n=1 Tax=Colletotrichum godetiae TaxID=1209918 RepID=A0AAJ0AED7_9PEZI|nr:uncharacterized protein BDP55DRAFT_324182 [Colletotrichum godetiae]KAK1660041.1 hypothetical protein BDP55DRAFT_324182 [Colletotrichum godetiae]